MLRIKIAIIYILMAAALACAAEATAPRRTLPFIDDDYSRALAQAKTKNVPIFVDAWAPW